jgi:RNA polymerase sigma-70 factor (ECF subfamily)
VSPVASRDVVVLYQRWFPVVRRKCARMLGDPAEAQDVAQETFERLWRQRAQVGTDPGQVVAWLYTTSTRLAVDRLRRRRPESPAEELSAGGSTQPERVVAARSHLARVAAHLDEAELELLILWRIDGLSQPELATLTGTSERTVRRRLGVVQARLRDLEVSHGD